MAQSFGKRASDITVANVSFLFSLYL